MNTEKQAQVVALDSCIADAIKQCAKAIGQAVADGRSTCVHCRHFREADELCLMADQRPPAKVIAFGCPAFDPDIPF